ncbi:MAG: hypothetical protein GC189_06055 [Alphaproteobacteria bacterium]|nr:hypothetical protein [Alphaproteobacteria bacterium]
MTDLDQAIRNALSIEDARTFDRLGADQPLHRQLAEMFQGQLAWMNVIVWIAGFALFAVGAYCAWNFFYAADLRAMLQWGGGAWLCFLGLALVKMWAWMEIQKNAVVREIKRVELQVAQLRRG